ncbi:MAG: hypothetical protein ACI87E_000319 [Mariniblastus sp.]|jgi:hypothetical protein
MGRNDWQLGKLAPEGVRVGTWQSRGCDSPQRTAQTARNRSQTRQRFLPSARYFWERHRLVRLSCVPLGIEQ